jgi:hypothetical protein
VSAEVAVDVKKVNYGNRSPKATVRDGMKPRPPRAFLALLMVTGALVGCAHATASPAPAGASPGAPPIKIARFTTTFTLDGGAFTVTPPPTGAPGIAEDAGIATLRSMASGAAGGGRQLVGNVFVGYGLVSVRLGKPVPAFPAWVLISSPAGPTSCPPRRISDRAAPSRPPVAVPVSRDIRVLDARTARTGLVYREGGSNLCGTVAGPRVNPALASISLPWTLVRRKGHRLTLRYQATDCAVQGGYAISSGGLTVLGTTVLDGVRPCPTPPSPTLTINFPRTAATPGHAPVGPMVAIETGGDPNAPFVFDDGR